MELRHIRVFLALAEELHFGKAARRLRVAQSAVSQTLHALEEEVGATLFTRTKRSVALSAAGHGFVEHARSALAQIEQATAAARLAASGQVGELRLRFTLMSSLTVLPRVVSRFKRDYPAVQIHIDPGGSVEQLDAIRAGLCDIGFMALKRDLAPLASEVVERSPLVAVLSNGHPLARKQQLQLSDLRDESFIFLKQQSEPQLHQYFRQNCARAGFEPKIVMEVEQLEPLLSFVAAGVGVACVPGLVGALGFRGIKLVPLLPEVRGGISAVWHPGRLSATAARFLELLRAELASSRREPE